ncbi:hypothetical protein GUITHDRAFT_152316 [Guillardia theta CCMP2712]|uniref:Uncharacterized protein n=1 Tax=Guillardia theta (strain CCMP2712) TaxID=905079 RepID=L1JE20_GUITC|nr:hypothetical protein GUITHDRAFT_152316 [Guillardia theta CCMP2712]EKX46756.1 hypothetical protein GUITHDRAFT_152316 [Guillardia theta CCMP2712]|eukprot:XP_005833736.1 hypothetical protein GUITHDRAFT_152316 [Guillardia theta CCMP2712]
MPGNCLRIPRIAICLHTQKFPQSVFLLLLSCLACSMSMKDQFRHLPAFAGERRRRSNGFAARALCVRRGRGGRR